MGRIAGGVVSGFDGGSKILGFGRWLDDFEIVRKVGGRRHLVGG